MKKENKWYYPVSTTGTKDEKESYLNFRNTIKEMAIKTEVSYGAFYDDFYYTMANGTVYKEEYNTESGYSYSIERVTAKEDQQT